MRGRQVVALDHRDQVTGLDVLSLLHVSVWMRPGIFALTTTSLASTVPIRCRSPEVPRRQQVPDQRSHRQQPQDHENSISCVHCFSHQRFRRSAGNSGIGVSASTRAASSAPWCRSIKTACPRNSTTLAAGPRALRAQRDRIRQQVPPHRRGQKVEDVGSQRRQMNLHPVRVDQFARGNALAHHGLVHERAAAQIPFSPGSASRPIRPCASRIISCCIRLWNSPCDRIRSKWSSAVRSNRSPGVRIAQKNRHRAVPNLRRNHLQGRRVEVFLAVEVVVDQRFVDGGGGRDRIRPARPQVRWRRTPARQRRESGRGFRRSGRRVRCWSRVSCLTNQLVK